MQKDAEKCLLCLSVCQSVSVFLSPIQLVYEKFDVKQMPSESWGSEY